MIEKILFAAGVAITALAGIGLYAQMEALRVACAKVQWSGSPDSAPVHDRGCD